MAQLNLLLLLKLSLIILVAVSCVSGKHFRAAKLGAKNRLMPTKVDPGSINDSQQYEVYNYTQTLDHFNFNPESYTTFQQRYVVDSKYWGGPTNSSPIFLYTGEETNIMGDVKFVGFVRVLASRFKGLVVYIEVCLCVKLFSYCVVNILWIHDLYMYL